MLELHANTVGRSAAESREGKPERVLCPGKTHPFGCFVVVERTVLGDSPKFRPAYRTRGGIAGAGFGQAQRDYGRFFSRQKLRKH